MLAAPAVAAEPSRATWSIPVWLGAPPPEDARNARDARRNSLSFWIGSAANDGYLREIAVAPWTHEWGDDTFFGVSYSHRLLRFWTDFALDLEGGAGYRAGETNTPEAWVALYVRFDGFPWRHRLYTSFGLSTGVNWLMTLPPVETGTAALPEPHQSNVLHYLSPELAFSLPSRPQDEVVLRYAHRSGVFGLFNGVWEGSNVLQIAYRRRF